jgi:hypothetical protein
MLQFRVKRIVPPGGKYFYQLGDSLFEAYDMRSLLLKVRIHATVEKIELPQNLEEVVVDYMCRKLPNDFCYGSLDGRPRARVVTMAKIKDITLAKARQNGRVGKAEASRRAVTCANCAQDDRTLCPSCVGLLAWSRKLVGSTLAPRDEWLGVCNVDAASLSAVVHIDEKNPEGDFPDNCWRKTDGRE